MISALVSSADPTGQDLGGVAGWAVDLMERLGAVGAGIVVALENLFPPIPSEIILPLAGFTASRGTFTLTEALVWTTVGSVVGALLLYVIGAAFGRDRMYWVWERMPLVKTSDLEKTEAWFARHGKKAVFFGRMIPLFRSLISVPAGIERMPVLQFLGLTLAGSLIWNTIFVLLGFYLGENWEVIEPVMGVVQWVVIGVTVALLSWWLVNRVRAIRSKRAA